MTHRGVRVRSRVLLVMGLVVLGLARSAMAPSAMAADVSAVASDELIREFFPAATATRDLESDLDDHLEAVKRMPLPLHYSELGRVTAHVVYEGRVPMGLVIVRPEADRWGMTEIAWALDLDLRVVDFKLLRCRDRRKQSIAANKFRAQLRGRSVSGLMASLSPGGVVLSPRSSLDVSEGARPLAAAVVRSGAKTALLSAVVWTKDIHALRTMRFGLLSFPDAIRFQRVDPGGALAAKEPAGAADLAIAEERTVAFRALATDGELLGVLVKIAWRDAPATTRTWWAYGVDGKVVVHNSGEFYEPIQALESDDDLHLDRDSLEVMLNDPRAAIRALIEKR